MKPTFGFRSANMLYLMVMCLMVANVLLTWLPQHVRLTLNEILFVFLPGYLYLRFTRQPVAGRVRWRWPGWRVALLALAIGAGLYPLSAVSASVLVGVLGYTNLIGPADAIPTTTVMGLFAILSYAVLAPLCEEFLFRGILQPIYETRGWKWGVLFVGFLFVAFHLSLLQGLSIVLLALALGLVNYRTQSLPASILTHFGANGLAALVVTQKVFPSGIQNWITSLPALVGGLLLSGLSLLVLLRRTAPVTRAEPAIDSAALRVDQPLGMRTAWPLLVAMTIFLAMIGVEWVYSRSPQGPNSLQSSGPALQVGASPWPGPQTWRYEIRNVADAVVGEGECHLTLEGDEMEITCTSTVEAYEVKRNQSTYASAGGSRVDVLRWSAVNGRLISGSSTLDLIDGYGSRVDFRPGDGSIEIRHQVKGEAEKRLDLPFSETALSSQPDFLLAADNTWPWQLAGLLDAPRDPGQREAGAVLRFNPYTWNSRTQSTGPLAEPRQIEVADSVEVEVPRGKFTATSVSNGDRETAWYAILDGTPTVVQYFNGIETWILK